MRKVVFLGVLVLFLHGFAGRMSAQNNRAAITGTVLDSTGAVVPGARAVAINSETAIATSTESNGNGIYSLLNLPPGIYSVSIKKDGFKTVEFTKVSLIVAQVAELNATLDLGRVNDTVTVTSDAPVLETETSTVGTNMNGSVVTDLPLNIYGGRSVESFAVALTPGYSPSSSPYLAVINGNQGFTKEFTVDGTSGTSQIQGDSMEVGPSMEAVEELQAETSGVSAKNASTNGGVMMFNLKSGTNKFHGTAFGYGHNEFLDANGFDNDHLGTLCRNGDFADAPQPCGQYNKTESRFWDYGFSAGGPIIKDKTFVFGAFERFTQNDFRLGNFGSTVPTADFLQGNFGALLDTAAVLGTDVHGNPVYKGAIFNPSDPGAVFVGNVIPAGMISPTSQKIVDLYQKYYAPEQSGLVENNRSPASNSPAQTPNQIVVKVDHSFTQNDKVSGSWVYNHRPRTLLDSGGVWQAGTADGGPFTGARYQIVKSDEYRASESHTFSSNVLNVFNATYNWYSNGSLPTTTGDWPQQLGFGSTGAGNFPAINFGGGVNGREETAIGNAWQGDYSGATFVYGDQLSWTKGRHTMTFGGDFRAMQINSHSGSGALSFNFSNNDTGDPTSAFGNQVGFGFASFLLGDVQFASQTTPFNLYGRRKALSLYAQDDFKVTHNLTLNLGLRWDSTFRFHEKYGHWASFDLNAIDPNLGIPGSIEYAKNGSDSFEKYQDWRNFGPQIGFAYNPWSKVVFRGAFGVTYVPIGIQYWQGVPYGFDPGFRASNIASTPFQWDGGYPGVNVPGAKVSTPDSTMLYLPSIDPHSLNAGYTDNFNIGAQFEVTSNTKVEVTYVGNRGHRLQDSGLAYNETTPSKFMGLVNSGHFYDFVSDQASADAAGVKYPYPGFSNYAFVATAPFPQVANFSDTYWFYPNLYIEGFPHGQSYYNSLIFRVSKRMAKGLSMDLNYTLSKQQGDTYTNFGDSYDVGYIQDFTNLAKEAKSLSVYDQTHVVKGFAVYQLPFGRGHAVLGGAGHFLNALVSGWSVSGLVGYASGLPLGFGSSNYYWYPAWSTTYVNFTPEAVGGRKFDPSNYVRPTAGNPNPSQNLYFSPGAATDPTYGTLGNGPARISSLRGFGAASEDASILKYFRMGSDGQYSLSLRFEFYNIFNRHSFENPVTNITDPRFGYVPGASGDPRQGQFGARFQW